MRWQSLGVCCTLAVGLFVTTVPGQSPKAEQRLKDTTFPLPGGKWVTGIVEKIDDDGMLLVELDNKGGTIEHKILPVDLLRKGKLLELVKGPFAYRWPDVKRGDMIEVHAKQDQVDKEWYCTEISVMRRPGGKLPESQDPKGDAGYRWRSLTNDIENGEDVSDEVIMKILPPRPERKDSTGKVTPAYPGGLPKEWQAKLDAVRAKKKDKDLKAAPPEKK